MNDDIYYNLSVLANMVQLIDFQLNMTQLTNDDLMKHLLEQDSVLDEQTNVYLKKIIEQNDEIIKLLKDKK